MAMQNSTQTFNFTNEVKAATHEFLTESQSILDNFTSQITLFFQSSSTRLIIIKKLNHYIVNLFDELIEKCRKLDSKVFNPLSELIPSNEVLAKMFNKYIEV